MHVVFISKITKHKLVIYYDLCHVKGNTNVKINTGITQFRPDSISYSTFNSRENTQ